MIDKCETPYLCNACKKCLKNEKNKEPCKENILLLDFN